MAGNTLIQEHVCVLGLMPGLRNSGHRETWICLHGVIDLGKARVVVALTQKKITVAPRYLC